MKNLKLTGGLVFLIVVFAFIGVYIAYAQNSGTISACVEKDGEIYLVGKDYKEKKCARGDKSLSWNIEGLQGPKGETGPGFSAGDFYIMSHGPFQVNKNEVSSFGVGCEDTDDIAIAGGPDLLNASGGLIYWDTTQNRPDSAAQDSWLSTVVYRGPDPTATFTLNLKCLKLPG